MTWRLTLLISLAWTLPLAGVEPPQVVCKMLSEFNPSDWKAVTNVFQDATPLKMQQAWHKTLDPAFKSGLVRTGWRGDSLWVYAEMEDASIFNPTTKLNEFLDPPPGSKPSDEFDPLSTTHGDVFEIFLRNPSKEPYVELHITPQNQAFQLRWLSHQDFVKNEENDKEIRKRAIPPPKAFVSYTFIDEKNQRWFVLAAIPFSLLDKSSEIGAGESLRFSFSRYDRTKGRDIPIFSSTSPHLDCDFHRQEEWGSLVFERGPAVGMRPKK